MIGGFAIGAAAIGSQPEYTQGHAGLVLGGDFHDGQIVRGRETAGSSGIVSGGDSAVGFVVGGDGRAG